MSAETDDQTERHVLGAMLSSPRAVLDATEILTGSDFHQPRHEIIFAAIEALSTTSSPIGPVSVSDHLGAAIGKAGGLTYLFDLVTGCPTAASAGYYAKIVRDRSTLRRVATIGVRLQQMGETGEGDALEVLNDARAELDSVALADTDDTPHDRAVYEAIESLERPVGDPTPWDSLNQVIGAWRKGGLHVIGARTSVGKSVFGVDTAISMARGGKRAILFSLEMSRDEIYLRMLSSLGSIDGKRITHRTMGHDDHKRMAVAAKELAALPITVDDRASLSVAQIRAKVRAIQRDHEVGVVVVDYLGKVKPPNGTPRNDRRVQVDAIAWGLKETARELNVPFVVPTQLNRAIEGRAEKIPVLGDLRESGGQENDSDVVILLHRDVSGMAGDSSVLHVYVAKNRHGPTSSGFTLTFKGHYSRIEESQWTPVANTEPRTA